MTTQVVPGRFVAPRETAGVAVEAAHEIASALRGALAERGHATLALSGGHTPRDAYRALAHEAGIDWSHVDVFWVDERAVSPTDDRSNYRWAKATLLDAAAVPESQVHRMVAESPDLEAAATSYERIVSRIVAPDAKSEGVPAFDVVVLGIGDDGHTASLFPGEPTVDITDRLVVAVPARPPREARMTLTAPLIENARHVLILAVGAAKHDPLVRAWDLRGSLQETPARVLRSCRGSLVWIVDRSAAGLD